jgi:hypothetical protein
LGFFHFAFWQGTHANRVNNASKVRYWTYSTTKYYCLVTSALEGRLPWMRGISEPRRVIETRPWTRAVGMRHNLMMTLPFGDRGVLVASNPTDEGRIGTGRNTWRGLDEKSIN